MVVSTVNTTSQHHAEGAPGDATETWGRRVTGPAGSGSGSTSTTGSRSSRPATASRELLDLAESVEELGFDSVWVGDSLFSKPRYEPMALLSALSQRTKRVKLGTACIVTSPRNPLYLALEWATLDVLSGRPHHLRGLRGQPGAGRPPGVRGARASTSTGAFAIFEEGLDVSCVSCGPRAGHATTAT